MSLASARWVLAGVVGLLVVAVGWQLLAGGSGSDGPSDPAVREGVSCRALAHAAAFLRRGDERGFSAAVQRAAAQAEDALETSGVLFGPPERIALTTRASLPSSSPFDLRARRDLGERMRTARDHCSDR